MGFTVTGTNASAAPAAPPTDPEAYAAATFEAWLQGDAAGLAELAAPPVAGFLEARAPEDAVGWHDPVCDGAAGATYCTWHRAETQLTIRVANEPASGGQPHAVTNASFDPVDGNVAIWPYLTAEEAANSQDQVDQGHSPWQLDPAAVSASYAEAVLGWQDAGVEPARPNTYWLTDPASGARAELVLGQPVRQGEGGIWAVVRATSIALG